MQTETLERCLLCASADLETLDPECHIARCRGCGYVFDDPRPALSELVAFYSRPAKYDGWLAQTDVRERLWRRRLRKLQPTRNPGSLLDVGAGIGQFLALARGTYDAVYGTEISSTAVAIAREKYGLELFQGTIEDLPRDRTFDNVALFHVLEHVPDPKKTLETCYRLLAPGGVLAIAVPNEVASFRGWLRRTRYRLGIKPPAGLGRFALPLIRLDGSMDEIHLSHFTPPVLRELLKACGFEVVRSTLDPYFVSTGGRGAADRVYYSLCSVLGWFGFNVYDAMLIIARKPRSSA